MFERRRLKKIHAKFLSSCRNLREGREFWEHSAPIRRWVFELITPIPLLGLHEDGRRLLDALQWLELNCRTRPLVEQVVRTYHKLVDAKPGGDPGEYRKHEIVMAESAIRRRPAQQVVPAMKAFEARLLKEQQVYDEKGVSPEDLLRLAIDVHHRIGIIHPFADANGRVARLCMNHLMRRYGGGYIVYPPLGESAEMWDALQAAHRGNMDLMTEMAKRSLMPV